MRKPAGEGGLCALDVALLYYHIVQEKKRNVFVINRHFNGYSGVLRVDLGKHLGNAALHIPPENLQHATFGGMLGCLDKNIGMVHQRGDNFIGEGSIQF